MKRWLQILWVLALGWLIAGSPAAAQEVLQAAISPRTIAIDAIYNGSDLLVSGRLPADCEAVVRIMGERGDLHLKKKGKVGGLLWMNLDTITVQNVPAVFRLYTAKDFAELIGPPSDSSAVRKLGLAFLQEETGIVADSSDHVALFKEFLKLKESEGLYSTTKGLLAYPENRGGEKTFEVKAPIPAHFPPGKYQVEVYAVKAGEVRAQANQPLEVKMVGLPALLASFAFQNGALYGLFAVVVALLAGLVIGVVFSGSKGGSH
jgi:uncharacterized protein (TIGR02186 family)